MNDLKQPEPPFISPFYNYNFGWSLKLFDKKPTKDSKIFPYKQNERIANSGCFFQLFDKTKINQNFKQLFLEAEGFSNKKFPETE